MTNLNFLFLMSSKILANQMINIFGFLLAYSKQRKSILKILERFVGNATTKYASLIEKFGPFSSKEEIEKFDKEALAEFGWPCVIGGKKVLCCMKPTIWDIFKEITRLLT
jgi:hypothetical protein